MQNTYELKLENEIFEQFRIQFDAMFQGLLDNMEHVEAEDGKMSFSCEVRIDDRFDENGDMYKSPRITWDIQTQITEKQKRSGGIVGDYQLCFDDDEKLYTLSPPPSAQMELEAV